MEIIQFSPIFYTVSDSQNTPNKIFKFSVASNFLAPVCHMNYYKDPHEALVTQTREKKTRSSQNFHGSHISNIRKFYHLALIWTTFGCHEYFVFCADRETTFCLCNSIKKHSRILFLIFSNNSLKIFFF